MEDFESLALTKQRETVLRVIRQSEKHLTANEVFDEAKQMMPGISFATVYNSLNYLKKEKLIGEIKFGTNSNLYDRTLIRHDHALCDNCGKLVDLQLPIPKKLLEKAADLSKFKPATIEVTLRGLCPECSKT